MNYRFLSGFAAAALCAWLCHAKDGEIGLTGTTTNMLIHVQGSAKDEWRFQFSQDLTAWTNAPDMASVFSGQTNLQAALMNAADTRCGFVRAVKTEGLFDANLLRNFTLSFTNANWQALLVEARTTSGNVPCTLALDNGATVENAGARYRGNTSYELGGNKKSVNLDINYSDSDARLMDHRALNLNNAAGDDTIMREAVYFNVMHEYAPCPQGAVARLTINGQYWGVYSLVQQFNNELVDEWFNSHDGDRWRAPNMGGEATGTGTTNGIPGDISTNNIPGGMTNGIPGDMTNNIPGGMTNNIPGGMTNGIPGGFTNNIPGGMTNGIPGGDTNNIPGGMTNGIPGDVSTNGVTGGQTGFESGTSAFTYLGAAVSNYANCYELKSNNSTNAWERLVHAIDVLNNTSSDLLRDKVEDVFAVDRWLWFLAVENTFVDDDSYWNKGADYAFYYEPESGRIHPVEHDGNEAFVTSMGITYTLSPVEGVSNTNRPIISKLLSIPELRQRYLAHMRTVLDQRFNPEYLTRLINRYHDLTVAGIEADTKKNFTMAAYTNELAALKTYVTNRYNFLRSHAELTPLTPSIVSVNDPSPLPGPSDVPYITAQVQAAGNEGIDSVWLYWRDKNYGRFSVAQMFDDGAHHDGAANDGLFGAATTNYPAGNKIHYYIEARSANSAKAAVFSPARAEQNTHSYRVALATAAKSPVAINELMAANTKTIADPQGDFDDWIELRNLEDQAVDLTGRYLTDDASNPRKWQFPSGTTIPAGGFLLIWADEDGSAASGLHASFKLEKSGEQLFLIDTDESLNAVLDSVSYDAMESDVSYGRSPENADKFITMLPTPGKAN